MNPIAFEIVVADTLPARSESSTASPKRWKIEAGGAGRSA
jgi:hypothetical protein